eukprot:scaffold75118_cov60-Phaeocystis_antarctica.AAC.1
MPSPASEQTRRPSHAALNPVPPRRLAVDRGFALCHASDATQPRLRGDALTLRPKAEEARRLVSLVRSHVHEDGRRREEGRQLLGQHLQPAVGRSAAAPVEGEREHVGDARRRGRHCSQVRASAPRRLAHRDVADASTAKLALEGTNSRTKRQATTWRVLSRTKGAAQDTPARPRAAPAASRPHATRRSPG